jgi:hypothetical protein
VSPAIAYREVAFRPATESVIAQAIQIAGEYARAGYSLTLRQLYYRFVAASLIPNRDSEYKRLGAILVDARYAGLFDWDWLTDRTRNIAGGDGSMMDPSEVIEEWAFAMALWKGQRERVEVWVEKDALVDVVGRAARALRTPYFSCRGYTSVSEIWGAAQRIEGYLDEDDVERVTVLHLGDHDPSGIDMTRDISARLYEFLDGDGYGSYDVEVQRIALNMDQVEQYRPPPNPAKVTDSRSTGYIARYGGESWELDALEPQVLDQLIRQHITSRIDLDLWKQRDAEEDVGRATLRAIKENYATVVAHLREKGLLNGSEAPRA